VTASDKNELESKGFQLWRSVENGNFRRHGRTDNEYWHVRDYRQFIWIKRDSETGIAFHEKWLDVADPWRQPGGRCHRLDGPAVTKRDRFTGAVIYEAYHVGGKKMSECHYPENESRGSRALRGADRPQSDRQQQQGLMESTP
jgi:hypothetical protein